MKLKNSLTYLSKYFDQNNIITKKFIYNNKIDIIQIYIN